MHLLILGASGGTGSNLISQGLKKAHFITAFVRNPAKIRIRGKNLSIIQGNTLNQKDVENAMKGQDVVISVLGNKARNALWKKNTIISESVKNIISAMLANNVKRLLFVTSFAINENIFFPEKLFIRIILKNIFADIPRQEALIKASALDWTIAHPARLINASKTGIYKRAENLPIGLFSKIARSDVADFLLNSMEDKSVIRKVITLSY